MQSLYRKDKIPNLKFPPANQQNVKITSRVIPSKIQIFWNLTQHLQYIEAIAEGLSTIPLKFKKENVVKKLKM